ncbi:MAG: universal stress protein [Rhodospirillaceae bacterium]
MSIKNILVAFNGTQSAVSALRYGAKLGLEKEAHVTAILAHSRHETINTRSKWIPDQARNIIRQANEDILQSIRDHFQAMAPELGLGERLHFLDEEGRVDAVLSDCARTFDLVIIGHQTGQDTDGHVMIHPDRVALMSGRPILMVPEAYDPESLHSHVVLAWDGGRASTRALADSLHILEATDRVSAITVGKDTLPRPVEELVDQLTRHGVKIGHEFLDQRGSIADTLLSYCREKNPSLLVMGAYEHSKFREDFLGGVTAKLMKEIPIPILLSH